MEKTLKEILDEILDEVEQELEEATTTAGVDGYQTPFAFGAGRKKDKKKEKDVATQAGYTIAESVNEGIEPQIKKIAYFTGTRPEAVEDFVSKHALNITKLLKYVEKGGLPQRMELVSALAGRPNNPKQKKIIKQFQESVNEVQKVNPTSKKFLKGMKKIKVKGLGGYMPGVDYVYVDGDKYYFVDFEGDHMELKNISTIKQLHKLHGKSLGESVINEYLSPSDVDSVMKEKGIKKIPISSQGERLLKGMVKEKFFDKITNKERLVYFYQSLGKERFGYGVKGKPLSPLVDRFSNDLMDYSITFGGKMAAYQVAMNIKDRLANREEVDSTYYMLKDYFNSFGMDTNRSRVFKSANFYMDDWLKKNKKIAQQIGESVNEGKVHFEKKLKSGNIFQVTDRDTKGMRGTQDKFSMQIVDKRGKVIKHIGSHPSLDGAKKIFRFNKRR
jgi:hypothetical protein